MPGHADCDRCPFRADPEVRCVSLDLSPGGPGAFCLSTDPRSAESARRITLERLARRAEAGGADAGPSPVRKVLDFATAVARHVAAGMPAASPEVLAARLDTCQQCPRYRPDSGTCGVCGCTLRVKAAWALESCPEGRWEA